MIAQPSNLTRALYKASNELTAPPSSLLAANLLSVSSSPVSKSLVKAKRTGPKIKPSWAPVVTSCQQSVTLFTYSPLSLTCPPLVHPLHCFCLAVRWIFCPQEYLWETILKALLKSDTIMPAGFLWSARWVILQKEIKGRGKELIAFRNPRSWRWCGGKSGVPVAEEDQCGKS